MMSTRRLFFLLFPTAIFYHSVPMFSKYTSTLQRVTPRVGLKTKRTLFCRNAHTRHEPVKKKNPLVYTTVLLVLFGSQLLNIMSIKKETADMEKRYRDKISVLQSCVSRLEKGEAVDTKEELKGVNRAFQNYEYTRNKDYAALEAMLEGEKSTATPSKGGHMSKNAESDSVGFQDFLSDVTKPEKSEKVDKVDTAKKDALPENVEIMSAPEAAAQREVTKFL